MTNGMCDDVSELKENWPMMWLFSEENDQLAIVMRTKEWPWYYYEEEELLMYYDRYRRILIAIITEGEKKDEELNWPNTWAIDSYSCRWSADQLVLLTLLKKTDCGVDMTLNWRRESDWRRLMWRGWYSLIWLTLMMNDVTMLYCSVHSGKWLMKAYVEGWKVMIWYWNQPFNWLCENDYYYWWLFSILTSWYCWYCDRRKSWLLKNEGETTESKAKGNWWYWPMKMMKSEIRGQYSGIYSWWWWAMMTCSQTICYCGDIRYEAEASWQS